MLKADLGFTDKDGSSRSQFANIDSVEMSELERVLYKYAQVIASYSGENLRKNKFGKDSTATGNLEQSITISPVKLFGSNYVVEISMLEYWKWVNDGRSPGKRPPISAIMKWIVDKKLRLEDGGLTKKGYKKPGTLLSKKPDLLRMRAYKIASKIAKFGTQGTSFVSDAVNEVRDDFRKEILKAIGKDIEINLKR